MHRTPWLIVIALLTIPAHAFADGDTVSAELAAGLRRFEQQVKSEIGGVRGERLVEETEVSVNLSGAYHLLPWFGVGAFVRWDVGSRHAGRFEGLDEEDRTVVVGEVGGAFQELWFGPLLRFRHDWFRASVGYGAVGARLDDARTDLTAEGATDGALRTSPTVAWLAALDLAYPTGGALRPLVRFEYRVRYYDRRTSGPLDDELVHGTQNFTVLVGVAADFGPD